MILLALSLLASRDELYSTDSLGLDTLPPPGFVNLVTATRVHLYPGPLTKTESTFVERGSGTGRRTTAYRDASISEQRCWTLVEEGFTRGLARPDLTIETEFLGDTAYVAYRARREILPDGNRWIHDSIPGMRYMRWGPETLLVRVDGQGREIEYRMSGERWWDSKITEWGPYGPTREAHYLMGRLEEQIFTTWQDGIRIHQLRDYGMSGCPGAGYSEESFGDTLEATHCSNSTGYRRNRLDSLGRIIASWAVGPPGDTTTRDTTRWVYDSAGRLHQTIKGNGIHIEEWNRDAQGHLTSRRETNFALSYGTRGRNPRTILIDSIEWKDHRIQRRLMMDCFVTDTSHRCQDDIVDTYTYATIAAAPVGATTEERPTPVRVTRSEQELHWIGAIRDGSTVRVRSLDGRLQGSCVFNGGRADIASPRGTGVLVWTIVGDGLERLGGSILP